MIPGVLIPAEICPVLGGRAMASVNTWQQSNPRSETSFYSRQPFCNRSGVFPTTVKTSVLWEKKQPDPDSSGGVCARSTA